MARRQRERQRKSQAKLQAAAAADIDDPGDYGDPEFDYADDYGDFTQQPDLQRLLPVQHCLPAQSSLSVYSYQSEA